MAVRKALPQSTKRSTPRSRWLASEYKRTSTLIKNAWLLALNIEKNYKQCPDELRAKNINDHELKN